MEIKYTKLAKFILPIRSRTCFLFVLLLCTCSSLLAQKKHFLVVKTDKQNSSILEKLEYQTELPDSLAVISELQQIILKLHGQSFLEASIDSLNTKDSTHTAQLHVGSPYKWAHLKNGNVEQAFLNQAGYRERLYQKKPFYYTEVRKLQESLLKYAEDNGYPFANVWLDDIKVSDGTIAAKLMMKKNRLITIDKIIIKGKAKVTSQYLENYLGLKSGSLYSKAKILQVKDRIRELPFVKAKQELIVTFKGNKATINLFLEKKKASRFDFLVGLAPNSNSLVSKRLLLTGTFNADMHNQLGLGERIFAEFQQLRPGTQELELAFTYPYILNLPFGVDTKLDLFKRDSTSLDIDYDFGIQYLFEGGNYIKAFWNNRSTNVLTIDEEVIIRSRQLPAILDVNNATFGLEYNLQKLDYRFNPRKGWGLFLKAGAGFKKIRKNATIVQLEDEDDPNFDFESLYNDSLNLRTFQYRIDSRLDYYQPLFARSVVKTSLQSGIILSEQDIYQNEQYRIGGNRLLRGFDEEAVFATLYAVATVEYRLLIGTNSYLYLFGDYAYIENKTTTIDEVDRPLGIGAGLTFETKVGLFGISYAIGKRFDDPFDFRAAKIHFGYVSLF